LVVVRGQQSHSGDLQLACILPGPHPSRATWRSWSAATGMAIRLLDFISPWWSEKVRKEVGEKWD
jgi:hypothetical protein